MMINNQKSKKLLDLIIIITIFLLPTLKLIPWAEIAQVSDFFQYYAVSTLMQTGKYDQIYDANIVQNLEQALIPNATHPTFPFLIPPTTSWIFYPLAWFELSPTIYIWSFALVLIIIVSYLVLSHTLNITVRQKLWLAVFIATSGPYLEAIRLGQLSPILLSALICLYLRHNQNKPVRTALSESIFWLKPHFLLPIFCLQLANRQIKVSLLCSLIGLAGLLISGAIAGFTIIKKYLFLLSSSTIQINSLGLIYGPTLRGQLLKFSLNYSTATQLAVLAYILLLIFTFFIGKKFNSKESASNLLFTVIIPLSLCLSLHLHNYDLLLLLPGIMLLISYPLSGRAHKVRLFIFAVMALVLISPIYVILHYFYVLQGGLINPFFWSTLTFAIGAFFIEKSRLVSQGKRKHPNQ